MSHCIDNCIDKKDISILVHGPIVINSKKALKQIRRLFTGSTIILSTWEGSDLDGLDYDIIIENHAIESQIFNAPLSSYNLSATNDRIEFFIDDHKYCVTPRYNNINKMLYTVKEGLSKVKTNFTLKMRSDIILMSDNFLSYWNKFNAYNGKYKIFENRIISSSTYAQFAHVTQKGIHLLPFHMSDWIHFGLTSDIKKLFSCPFQNIEDSSQYWYQNRKKKKFDMSMEAGWQYPPETYIFYSLVKKYYSEIHFENSDDYDEKNMKQSNLAIVDNFLMIDQDNFSFEMNKYPYIYEWKPELYDGFITYREWQNLYKMYCDHTYEYSDIDWKRLIYCLKYHNPIYYILYPKLCSKYTKSIIRSIHKKSLRKSFFITPLCC